MANTILINFPCVNALGLGLLIIATTSDAVESVSSSPSVLAEADYYFQELPIVLTASRLSQPMSEAPSAMTVIDREMIKASGLRTVPDLMRLVPGMYVGFQDANNPVVTLNGATDQFSRRMQILIDGRSIYMPPFGGVSWADLPLLVEDIERKVRMAALYRGQSDMLPMLLPDLAEQGRTLIIGFLQALVPIKV